MLDVEVSSGREAVLVGCLGSSSSLVAGLGLGRLRLHLVSASFLQGKGGKGGKASCLLRICFVSASCPHRICFVSASCPPRVRLVSASCPLRVCFVSGLVSTLTPDQPQSRLSHRPILHKTTKLLHFTVNIEKSQCPLREYSTKAFCIAHRCSIFQYEKNIDQYI